MKLHEAMSELKPKEILIDIERVPSGTHFSVLAFSEGDDGILIGDTVQASVDTILQGIAAARKQYHNNVPRLIYASEDRAFIAIKQVPIHKHLCHVYYQDGNGHASHEIYAETPQEAFEQLLVEIKDDVDPEEDSKPRCSCEQVTDILIEAARPLLPNQHPDTPPLWYTAAAWKAKRKVVTEWEPQVTDEDQAASEAKWAEAFATAQAMCSGSCAASMKAVVTNVTEFGCTGTMIPV